MENEEDSDDDLMIVQTTNRPARSFSPVDCAWQFKVCKTLNLNVHVQLTGGKSKPLSFPTVFRDVIGDGHCLFRSLSYCLTGSEESHGEIRKKIFEVIIIRIKSKYNFNELYLLIVIIFRSY